MGKRDREWAREIGRGRGRDKKRGERDERDSDGKKRYGEAEI